MAAAVICSEAEKFWDMCERDHVVETIGSKVGVPSALAVSAPTSVETADASNGEEEAPPHLSFILMENPYGQCMSFAVFCGHVPGLYCSWLVADTPSLMTLLLTFI